MASLPGIRRCIFLIVAVAACLLVVNRPSAQRTSLANSTTQSAPTLAVPLSGNASCSARACHGSPGPAGARNSEYVTWLLNDPHADAYTALLSDRSRQMQRLRGLPSSLTVPPEKDALCLSCHGSAQHQPATSTGMFSCESCHGPATNWLAEHTDTASWRTKTPAEKASHGLASMATPFERALACVACHVGSDKGEVNHDLIAAGHPRLTFEFSTYAANLPRHWQEKPGTQPAESETWFAGQAASSRAALQLLQARAARSDSPWPEFAEYDCYACHHSLSEPGSRRARGHAGIPGALSWNQWHQVGPRALSLDTSLFPSRPLRSSYRELDRAMTRPFPDRDVVRRLADETSLTLGKWFSDLAPRKERGIALDALAAKRDHGLLDAGGTAATIMSWDVAAQLLIALQVEYLTRVDQGQDLKQTPVAAEIAKLFETLRFENGAGPRDFDGRKFFERLQAIRTMMER